MSGPPPTAFPGGRVLAGWWRQLGPEAHGPIRAVWFVHLLLHRIESLFEVAASTPLDPVSRMLLRALALAPVRSVADLDASLHLGQAVLHRLLGGLHSLGLTEANDRGDWGLTSAGREAQGQDEFVRTERHRRVLHFLQDQPEGDRPARPPQFLNLHGSGVPWPAGDDWRFDPELVERCLAQSEEWKSQHGFPAELRRQIPPPADAGNGSWQQVILDRPEHLMTLVLRVADPTAEAGEALRGYAVRPDGWVLQATQPAFALTGDWQAVFPDLAEEPSADAWIQAWRTWCQPRGLPPGEVEACSVQREGPVLKVQAPGKLLERLKAAKSDAIKGEAWLLAGTGLNRAAALVEVVEAG